MSQAVTLGPTEAADASSETAVVGTALTTNRSFLLVTAELLTFWDGRIEIAADSTMADISV